MSNKTLHVEMCAIHHKETLCILITEIVTNITHYITMPPVLYYTALYYNKISFNLKFKNNYTVL
jgi:hypothetical protein